MMTTIRGTTTDELVPTETRRGSACSCGQAVRPDDYAPDVNYKLLSTTVHGAITTLVVEEPPQRRLIDVRAKGTFTSLLDLPLPWIYHCLQYTTNKQGHLKLWSHRILFSPHRWLNDHGAGYSPYLPNINQGDHQVCHAPPTRDAQYHDTVEFIEQTLTRFWQAAFNKDYAPTYSSDYLFTVNYKFYPAQAAHSSYFTVIPLWEQLSVDDVCSVDPSIYGDGVTFRELLGDPEHLEDVLPDDDDEDEDDGILPAMPENEYAQVGHAPLNLTNIQQGFTGRLELTPEQQDALVAALNHLEHQRNQGVRVPPRTGTTSTGAGASIRPLTAHELRQRRRRMM